MNGNERKKILDTIQELLGKEKGKTFFKRYFEWEKTTNAFPPEAKKLMMKTARVFWGNMIPGEAKFVNNQWKIIRRDEVFSVFCLSSGGDFFEMGSFDQMAFAESFEKDTPTFWMGVMTTVF